MPATTETRLSIELELLIAGTFQPGYAPTYMEPGQSDMIEDAEVTGVLVSKRVPGEFEDITLRNGATFRRPKYRDVDLLAKLTPAAKAEVLAALAEVLNDEITEQLLEDYEDVEPEYEWEAA